MISINFRILFLLISTTVIFLGIAIGYGLLVSAAGIDINIAILLGLVVGYTAASIITIFADEIRYRYFDWFEAGWCA